MAGVVKDSVGAPSGFREFIGLVNARDFEFPDEVSLHYFLYSIDLESGKINWKKEFYAGRPLGGGASSEEQLLLGTPVTDGKRVYVYINNLGAVLPDLRWSKLLDDGSRRT
jgi:hypothetical protein